MKFTDKAYFVPVTDLSLSLNHFSISQKYFSKMQMMIIISKNAERTFSYINVRNRQRM